MGCSVVCEQKDLLWRGGRGQGCLRLFQKQIIRGSSSEKVENRGNNPFSQ